MADEGGSINSMEFCGGGFQIFTYIIQLYAIGQSLKRLLAVSFELYLSDPW
jgi:hypothetical protein